MEIIIYPISLYHNVRNPNTKANICIVCSFIYTRTEPAISNYVHVQRVSSDEGDALSREQIRSTVAPIRATEAQHNNIIISNYNKSDYTYFEGKEIERESAITHPINFLVWRMFTKNLITRV